MMEDLKITLVQSDLHWEDIEANLSMFEEKIWNIKSPTDLILLPEMFTTGFSMNAKKMSELMNGKTHRWMKMIAEQTKATIAGSLILTEKKEFFNRLLVVAPDGSTQYYDKHHLFTPGGEGDAYTAGTQPLIFQIKGWKIRPGICYDLRFPVWARSRHHGEDIYEYDLLFYVANWPSPRIQAWDTLLGARAIENIAYCAGLNRLGEDVTGAQYTGQSGVYNFKGDRLAYSEKDETISVTLDAKSLLEFREKHPFHRDADHFELR